MEEILNEDSFVCHKTTNGGDKDRLQCAGHMLIRGDQNAFVSYAKAIGAKLDLRGKELVFDSREDCIEHHS